MHTWAIRFTDLADQFHTRTPSKYDAEIPCTVLFVATNEAMSWGKISNSATQDNREGFHAYKATQQAVKQLLYLPWSFKGL